MKEYCIFKNGELIFTINTLAGAANYVNDNSYVITQEYFKEKNLVTFLDDFNKYINVIIHSKIYNNKPNHHLPCFLHTSG